MEEMRQVEEAEADGGTKTWSIARKAEAESWIWYRVVSYG